MTTLVLLVIGLWYVGVGLVITVIHNQIMRGTGHCDHVWVGGQVVLTIVAWPCLFIHDFLTEQK